MATDTVKTCFHGDLDRVGTVRGLRRRWGRPSKHPANPLPFPGLPDQPVYDPNVYFDPDSGQWTVWYVTLARPPAGACQNPLALATSTDGIAWHRPALGIIDRAASSEANFVYAAEGKAVSGAGVLIDRDDPDPARGHKLFYCTQTWTPETGVKHGSDCRVAFSPDGLHWDPAPGNPVLPILSDARHSVFRDPRTGHYVCPVRLRLDADGGLLYRHGDPITAASTRCVGRIESSDFVHWSEPELIIAPSAWTTPGDSYYNLTMLPYEAAYVGLLQVFHRYAPNYGYLEEQLVISDDTHHWRPAGDAMFLAPGEPGEWDSGSLAAAPRVVVREHELLFYYGGTPRSHGGGTPVPLPEGGLGLATLRRDGFAWLEPPWQEGLLTTHPLAGCGQQLRVNVNAAAGSLTAAVLGADHAPILGYTHEDCIAVRTDAIAGTLRWRDRAVLPSAPSFRLEFRVREARFYAFALDPPMGRRRGQGDPR
jgi:hypothetical protein